MYNRNLFLEKQNKTKKSPPTKSFPWLLTQENRLREVLYREKEETKAKMQQGNKYLQNLCSF